MTRVSRASSSRRALAAAPLDRPRATVRKKKPYKVVLEAVTQEKRKVQSILTYHDQAPPGFGYIPVGHPELTEWCKEQCRQRNMDVHIVSAKPRSKASVDPEKISSHVHRIGHHFPLDIIEQACKKFGHKFDQHRGLRVQTRGSPQYGPAYVERGITNYERRQRLRGNPVTDREHKDHIRGAIREIFPKIPEADLDSIVNHAFQEGTNRVGNAKELSLARRVQLAVVAHIRHTYTEYDNILKHKTGTWTQARQQVEHVSLAKLKEWRDETDETSNELEETFREVIVLDDDDDDDSSEDESPATPNTREPSMEIISSRATARDLQPERFDRTRVYDPYVSRASRRTIVLRPGPIQSPRRIASPSHAHFSPQTVRTDMRPLPPVSSPVHGPLRPPIEYPLRMNDDLPVSTRTRSGLALTARHDLGRPYDAPRLREPAPRVAGPMQWRDSAGILYNLQPIEEAGPNPLPRIAQNHPAEGIYRQPRSYYPVPDTQNHRPTHHEARHSIDFSPRQAQVLPGRRPGLTPGSRRMSDQDVILPSVEREPDAPVQKRKSLPASGYDDYPIAAYEGYSEHSTKRMRPAQYAQPRGYDMVDLTSSSSQPVCSSGRDVVEVARPRAAPVQYPNVPMPKQSRMSPLRNTRDVYGETVFQQRPHGYVPNDRAYNREALPSRDFIPLSEAATRNEDRYGYGPYTGNGASRGY